MYVNGESTKRRNTRGFTLIELLVVVSIITLLATIVISSVNKARVRSQYARAQTEMQEFVDISTYSRGEASKTLYQLSGNNCSDCVCRTGLSMINDVGSCYSNWLNVLTKVQTAANGVYTNVTRFDRDPWGSPYLLDENEGESGGCGYDIFRTAGPDGIVGTSDDYGLSIPHSSPACPN